MLLLLHWFWLVLLMYMTSLSEVEAQFPRPCTTPEALDSRSCCPMWNGSICGSSSNRGQCLPHAMHRHPIPLDYRVSWPHFFYDTVCECNGNYDGFDCSQCLPGWIGPQCQEKHFLRRKEITDLTDSERHTFLSSLEIAKHSHSTRYVILTSDNTSVARNYDFHNVTVYDLYVWLHFYSAKSYYHSENNSAHKGPAFPFWHRVFLLFIEREIRYLTGNFDFYIPYWDWTRTDHCNICNNQYFGGIGEDGQIHSASPFSKWKTICPIEESLFEICQTNTSDPNYLIRKPGQDPMSANLPTAELVDDVMSTASYDTSPYNRSCRNSFRNRLEGFENPKDPEDHRSAHLHNLVHNYFDGTMTVVAIAANDPIFMVHHSYIDKLLKIWLRDHPNAYYPEDDLVFPAQRAKANMAPFFPLRTNDYWFSRDTESLGYTFIEHTVPLSRAWTSRERQPAAPMQTHFCSTD